MDRERLEITRRVMKAMRHPAARWPLAEFNSDGGRQIVVCLTDDTLEYTSTRVTAVGGQATVVIPTDGGLIPMSWVMDHQPEHHLFLVEPPMHPHSTLGMLLAYFEATGEPQLQFQIGLGEVDVREYAPISVPV